MKRGVRIWEKVLEIFERSPWIWIELSGIGISVLGVQIWACEEFISFSWDWVSTFSSDLEYPVFFFNTIKIYVSHAFSLLRKAV